MTDELTHEQLILIIGTLGPLLTALGAVIGSWLTARTAAKKNDLVRLQKETAILRERINKLEVEKNILRQENLNLREYISTLRIKLQENGIEIPALRDFDEDAWRKQ